MNDPATVLDQLIADPAVNGQHVDVDHEFGGQCWDLVELFAEKCGVPKAVTGRPWAIPLGTQGYAKEAWTEFDASPHMQQYFEKIPAGQQQKGDITIYGGHGPYVAGHIAISLGGNAVFEENADPDESPAHVCGNRASTFLLGALRIKRQGGAMPTVFNKDGSPVTQAEFDDAMNWKDAATAPGKVIADKAVLDDALKWKRDAIGIILPQLKQLQQVVADNDKASQILSDMQATINKYKK